VVVEQVNSLTMEHIGRVVDVTCKPMAGYHRIRACGTLRGFTYMDGLTIYLEGVDKGVSYPMIANEMEILVERQDD
jgi:hypothetical protein